jgi:hypothetical protein
VEVGNPGIYLRRLDVFSSASFLGWLARRRFFTGDFAWHFLPHSGLVVGQGFFNDDIA